MIIRIKQPLFVCLVLAAFFSSFTVLAYQNPGSPHGFVNDFAGILTPDQVQTLETRLASFADETQDEIAIVTIKTLGGDTIKNFAVQLFSDWGIGRKEVNNGILLLIAPSEKQIKIEVGYGLEGALTDAQSYWIIQKQILPQFRRGDYYAGINVGLVQIQNAIKGKTIPALDKSSSNPLDGYLAFIVFIIFGFVWLSSLLARTKSWWLGGIIGGFFALLISFSRGFIPVGLIASLTLIPFGFLLDYLVSANYRQAVKFGRKPPWWSGGTWISNSSSRSGGFTGFGGGRSGGGGASGSW